MSSGLRDLERENQASDQSSFIGPPAAAALLKTETDSRDSHGGQARIKTARFPVRKTLEEFWPDSVSSVRSL